MRNCPDCSETDFESRESLRYHRRAEHGFVVCDCRREFLKSEYMEQHRAMSKVHRPGTGKFKCAGCIKRFPKEISLLQHQRSLGHTGKLILDASEDFSNQFGSSGSLVKAFQGLAIAPKSDLYMLQRDEIDTFIANYIQVDSPFHDCCGEVIDTLVKKLHQIVEFAAKLEPREILKSGSLGKGTAVKNRADIDLVMMLNDYKDIEQLMGDMEGLLGDLERYLSRCTQARPQRKTRYSVQVQITCSSGHTHDADILPAVDLLGLGHSRTEIFQKMKYATKVNIHEYSVSLAPLQLEIIKPLPAKVKSLIKLLKYWKDEKLKERNESEMPSFAEKRISKPNWPSSYALELVVIGAWNDAGNPDGFEMAHALHAVLTSLVNHNNFKIVLKMQMKYSMDMVHISKMPYIMDPANPFNDMYHGLIGGKAFDWEKVVPEAKLWLSKPLFFGFNTSKLW